MDVPAPLRLHAEHLERHGSLDPQPRRHSPSRRRRQGSHIDARDVAAVAARLLVDGGHAGKAYELSGPTALTYGEVAAILSDVLGRAIAYESQSDDEALAEMAAADLSPAYAADMLDLVRFYRRGGGARVTADVRELLGREPIGFAQFAREHADAFR